MIDLGLLSKTHCFLIDLDGTLYLGEELLPGAMEFIEILKERELPFLLLTNNSSRHREQYREKISAMGLDISIDRIFTSGEATAEYLAKKKPESEVFIVGTPALEEVFLDHHFR